MKHFFKILYLPFLISLFSLPVSAQTPQQAWEMVEKINTEMSALLSKNKTLLDIRPAQVYRMVDEAVAEHFDFELMAKIVLGGQTAQGTAEQQARFLKEFRALMVRSYTISLLDYAGGPVRVLPLDNEVGPASRRLLIKTQLQKPDSSFLVPLDYELYRQNEKWKVFNVVIDGISPIITCRNSFIDEVENLGFEDLIERLEKMSEINNQDKIQTTY